VDIKEKIEELVEKITSDDKLISRFQKDPVSAIEGLLGVDLPNDQLNMIIDGVKARITMDDVSKLAGKLGGLFGR